MRTAFRTKALDKASALQLYFYARQLQADKKQDEALAIYRVDCQEISGLLDFASWAWPACTARRETSTMR